eukprot:scaffold518_cov388-Prasinococcus_capsulatus_cf.AAC.62
MTRLARLTTSLAPLGDHGTERTTRYTNLPGCARLPFFALGTYIGPLCRVPASKRAKAAHRSDDQGATATGELNDDLDEDVKGFVFSTLIERRPEKKDELLTLRDVLLSSSEEDDTLKVWDLAMLGLQAAQRIATGSEPLKLMQDIAQNFPALASSLSRTKVDPSFSEEVEHNQALLGAGTEYVSINGIRIDMDTFDPFYLLNILRDETRAQGALTGLGLPNRVVNSILQLDLSSTVNVKIDLRSPQFTLWFNNIEKDNMYRMWTKDIRQALMMTMIGQPLMLRKNVLNAIITVDPGSEVGLLAIRDARSLIDQGLPVRVGFSLGIAGSEGTPEYTASLSVIRGVYFLKSRASPLAARKFLYLLVDKASDTPTRDVVPPTLEQIEDAFEAVAMKQKALANFTEEIQGFMSTDDMSDDAVKSSLWVAEKGLTVDPPCVAFNGEVTCSETVASVLIQEMQYGMRWVTEMMAYGRIGSGTDVHALVLKGAVPRFNEKIASAWTDIGGVRIVDVAIEVLREGSEVSRLEYLHPPDRQDDIKPLTYWIVLGAAAEKAGGNVDSVGHIMSLVEAAARRLLDDDTEARVAFIFNVLPKQLTRQDVQVLSVLQCAISLPHTVARRTKIVGLLLDLVTLSKEGQFTSATVFATAERALNGGKGPQLIRDAFEGVNAHAGSIVEDTFADHRSICRTLLGLGVGESAILTNGRLVVIEDFVLTKADMQLMQSLEQDSRADAIAEMVEEVDFQGFDPDLLTADFYSDIIMASCAVVGLRQQKQPQAGKGANLDALHIERSGFVESSDSALTIDAIVNPTSKSAQKLAPLLLFIKEKLKPNLKVILNPITHLDKLPLQNFYRYAVDGSLDFNEDGSMARGAYASFANLPQHKTLTMNMDVPESWLVEAVSAAYDLDNLRLEDLGEEASTLHATYELEAIIVTGNCRERGVGPPRGLQLAMEGRPRGVDTLVMENLGYFQLKADPGVWALSIATGTRSDKLFKLSETKRTGAASELDVEITSFAGRKISMVVEKRPGMEDEELLLASSEEPTHEDEDQRYTGVWGSIKSMLGRDAQELAPVKDEPVIHVFSIASGHLYERFLKIMFISVLRNTKSPVKFWIIKNYLSPKFKTFLPYMAEEYGFDFEFITYKWPTWLHKQTEKQRLIWAYKILFLDVLFPIDLKKVIYVDADQIVRADLLELYTMDLQGAPYGYTPFCDNNKEVEGYRFWKQGFWKDHLRGKPYHISALYVVDLERFRQLAAGDQLRVVYDNLSKVSDQSSGVLRFHVNRG